MKLALVRTLMGLFIYFLCFDFLYSENKDTKIKSWLSPFFAEVDKDEFVQMFKNELELTFENDELEEKKILSKALELGQSKPKLAFQLLSSINSKNNEKTKTKQLYSLLKNYIFYKINPKFASERELTQLVSDPNSSLYLKNESFRILHKIYFNQKEYSKFLDLVDSLEKLDIDPKDRQLNRKISISYKQTDGKRYFKHLSKLASLYPLTNDSIWAFRELQALTKKDPRLYNYKLDYIKKIAKNEEYDSSVADRIDDLISGPIQYENTLFEKGFSQLEKFTLFKSIRLYRKAIYYGEKLIAEDNLGAWLKPHVLKKMAFCYYRIGQFKNSREFYKKSDKLLSTQKSPFALTVGARNEYYLGNFEDAADNFKQASKISNKPLYKWLTIWNRYLSGDYKIALNSLLYQQKRISKKIIDRKGIDYWKGVMYKKIGKWRKANNIWLNISRNSPHSYYGILAEKRLNNRGNNLGNTNFDKSNIRTASFDNLSSSFNISSMFRPFATPTKSSNSLEKQQRFLKNNYPLKFQDNINEMSRIMQIDPFLILSIVKAESSFNPEATSYVGAKGLMQLMPYTAMSIAKRLGLNKFKLEHLSEPSINLALGSYYIKKLLKKYDGNFFLAVAAYNAGPRNVDNWRKGLTSKKTMEEFVEGIPYAETRKYVKKVFKNFVIYSNLYKENSQWVAKNSAINLKEFLVTKDY